MSFRLIDSGWTNVFDHALQRDRSQMRIISPFITRRAVERLFKFGSIASLQVITRFNLCDFAEGVSDISALRALLERGAQIRGVRHLHAKVYIFGVSAAIVTSANLTEAALTRNHEFGFVAEEASIVQSCASYFGQLWQRAGSNLTTQDLERWDTMVQDYLANIGRSLLPGLPDEGTDAGFSPAPIVIPNRLVEVDQAFVKFFGGSRQRIDRSNSIVDELVRSGCHWACAYPKGRRPRSIEDGAVMFMGRLVKKPNDVMIYGRAIGMKHREGRDDATSVEVAKRDWKARYPHYIRVHHPEFIGGTLANGISLNELMTILGSDSFESTQRNALKKNGNTNPRDAYHQQPHVELSGQGAAWLNERLEESFAKYGRTSIVEIE